jgi:hypothetical protein
MNILVEYSTPSGISFKEKNEYRLWNIYYLQYKCTYVNRYI